jgi:ABC-2 type transport system permease protein
VGVAARRAPTAAASLVPASFERPSMFGRNPRRFFVLARMLAVTDFRLKYQHAVLNYAWALARPAALFTVMLLVFGALGRFNRDIPHYPAYLVLGIVIWMFFAQAVAACVGCLTRRGELLQKLPFPRLAVPASAIMAAGIDLAVNLVVVVVVMLATGVEPRWTWLELPVLLTVVASFATGIGLVLAALYVRYRDLDQLWAVVSQTLFYLTPIFYAAAHLPEPVRRPLLLLNPLAVVFTQARHALIDPTAPTGAALVGGNAMLLVPIGSVVGALALGLWVFARESPRVAEHV